MEDYPQLTEMGVRNPSQIEKFSVNSISNFDVLRIVYNRRKGSLLPVSRTYKFRRIQNSATNVMESNPSLHSAVTELQGLLEVVHRDQDVAQAILEELRLLEEDIALRSKCIRGLLKRS